MVFPYRRGVITTWAVASLAEGIDTRGIAAKSGHAASTGPTQRFRCRRPGADTRAYVVRNDGDTVARARTQFASHSNALVSIGLFNDQQIGQDWNIQALGSGYGTDVHIKTALQPGQRVSFALSGC